MRGSAAKIADAIARHVPDFGTVHALAFQHVVSNLLML